VAAVYCGRGWDFLLGVGVLDPLLCSSISSRNAAEGWEKRARGGWRGRAENL
jgi:hypothetical protein